MSVNAKEKTEASGDWTSGKYANFKWEEFLKHGVDPFFTARKVNLNHVEMPATPSNLWKQPLNRYPSSQDGEFKVPSGYSKAAIYSVGAFNMVSFKTKLPSLSEDQEVFLGFEDGSSMGNGIADFKYSYPDTLEAEIGGSYQLTAYDISDALPSDAETKMHRYSVYLLKGWAEYRIDGEIVAIGINSSDLEFPTTSYPPLCIFPVNVPIADELNVYFEAVGEGLNFPISPYNVRPAKTSKLPPRSFRLHDGGAETLLTEGTYDTGTSHKSHSLPAMGYNNKTLLFEADTDSVSGGLKIELLTQAKSWSWKTYDSLTYSADELESYGITADFPVFRIRYEPASDNASITVAEVHME